MPTEEETLSSLIYKVPHFRQFLTWKYKKDRGKLGQLEGIKIIFSSSFRFKTEIVVWNHVIQNKSFRFSLKYLYQILFKTIQNYF